jgi:hypothetical protein
MKTSWLLNTKRLSLIRGTGIETGDYDEREYV